MLSFTLVTGSTPKALIVDDEEGILQTLSGVLSDVGFATFTTRSGTAALELFRTHAPDIVFLDVWLPDRDGLEVLTDLKGFDPSSVVIMISGHGTAATAARAIRMGAWDYLEKPLGYDVVVNSARTALERRRHPRGGNIDSSTTRLVAPSHSLEREPPPRLRNLVASPRAQRTIRQATVLYGHGLHSGARTGLVLQPLPVDSGIHFLSLAASALIPAHVLAVADTEYATTLRHNGAVVRTVEHLLSALRAAGVTNLLLKVHNEVPVLDGSAMEFCRTLEEIGLEDQDAPAWELELQETIELSQGSRSIRIEPYPGFRVTYDLSYPSPIGNQRFDFELVGFEAYRDKVAPARTFGFLRDVAMLNELGLGTGGRLDNFILVGEDNVINTTLRFPDEFARHKVLDLIGDLYLLGYPIRGHVSARFTGHRDNIALVQALFERHRLDSATQTAASAQG